MLKRLLCTFLLAAGVVHGAEELPSSAPLFSAQLWDLQDKPATLERYQGKPLVVNFWARWCGPCRQEIPELTKFRAAHKGVEVIGIGIEDKPEAVKEFAKVYDMDYPVLLAKDGGIALMQSVGNPKGGLPFTLVIDRKGQVLSKKMGVLKPADLDAAAQLLGK